MNCKRCGSILNKEDKLYFFSSVNKKGRDELIDNLFLDIAEKV